MYFCAGRTRSDKNFLKPDTFLAGSDKLSGEWNKIRTKSIMFRTKFLKHLCLKVKLLREFSVIFLGNSLLVLLAWKVYGERIRNKFMTGRKVSKSLKLYSLLSCIQCPCVLESLDTKKVFILVYSQLSSELIRVKVYCYFLSDISCCSG